MYYPKSFLKLILIGFSLAVVPLIFALLNNAVSVDRLAEQSQKAVYQAVLATQSSRILVESLTAMERNARQYVILGERLLLERYQRVRKRFLQAIAQFDQLPLDNIQRKQLDEIIERERAISTILAAPNTDLDALKTAIEQFIPLSDLAQSIMSQSNDLIDREVIAMRDMAGDAQQIIFWQVLAVIPIAIFLVIGLTILVTRPIRQIDTAIRRLGDGEFSAQIHISGPEDLELLGQRLEWMRLRLIELEKQKNKFLRHVSHELKTPLTALREGTELLADGIVGKLTKEQHEVAEILRHNALELQKLIEDLLNYSVAQFQRFSTDTGKLKLASIIEQVKSAQALALKAKDLKVTIQSEQDLEIEADADKVRIIIDNLLSNAIKFSPPNCEIVFRIRRDGEEIILDVIDCGPGISGVDKPYIFEPFYQGQTEAGTRIKGTGLGLSIVKEYVEAHQGGIEVVETNEPGAHFRIRLPMNQKGA